MSWKLSALAEKLGLRLKGEDCEVTGINTLEAAGPGDISFLANIKYIKYLPLTKAAAVIVTEEHAASLTCALVSKNPYLDFSRAVTLFAKPQGSFSGISEDACIHPDAVLEEGCTVYPFVYIGSRAHIGKSCVLFPGCYVGEDCVLGKNCILYPHVTLMAGTVLGDDCVLQPGAVLGADGFGFIREGERVQKIPQIGTVRIGNNVEIGVCSAVDRAALGVTSVGDESKIDNLVQLGHNVTIGRRCFLVAQVGISGSTKVGDNVTMAGQTGVAGHLMIGNDVTLGPKSGVARDIPNGVTCGGTPVVEGRTYMRTLAVMPKLPDMYKRIGQLEQELAQLRALLEKDRPCPRNL